MNIHSIPQRNYGYTVDTVDDKRVLLHPARPEVVYLNATAMLVFELCDSQRSVDTIVDILQQAFPESTSIREDVETTLRRLADCGAISL